jgi:hypothetical protein
VSRIEPVKPATKYRKPLRTKRNSVVAAVVIVVASVLSINIAIKTLSGAHEYLVASAPAAAGTAINELSTRTISLNLGEASQDYLAPDSKLDGLVLTQALAVGDLLMKRDLAAEDPSGQRAHLAITTKNALPTKLEAGTKIDLWSAPNDGGGQYGEPQIIAKDIQVYATSGGTSLFGDAASKLEIVVEQSMVKPILAAVLHADAMSVVALNRVE